jgi:hypothetical protein
LPVEPQPLANHDASNIDNTRPKGRITERLNFMN